MIKITLEFDISDLQYFWLKSWIGERITEVIASPRCISWMEEEYHE